MLHGWRLALNVRQQQGHERLPVQGQRIGLNIPEIVRHQSRAARDEIGDALRSVRFRIFERNQVRMTLNWQPTDPLSLQFRVDESRDKYGQIHTLGIGPRSGDARNYTADLAYSFSDKWQATAWVSRNETEQEQSQSAGNLAAPRLLWAASLKNTGDSLGLGLRGKPFSWLEIGGDLSYSDISDTVEQQRLNAISPGTVVASLPEITTRTTRLQLFAKYAFQKHSGVRVDFIHDRYSTNDWTWSTWTYTDGTRLLQDPVQKTNFLGLPYYYRWQ